MMGPKKPGGPRPIMGRPVKKIDFDELDKLCLMQCTEAEIAAWFQCCIDTLESRIHEKFGVTFSEYFEEKKGIGKISLRRSQWQNKSTAMLIWKGKQYLGQADKLDTKVSGALGRYDVDALDNLTDIELDALIAKRKADHGTSDSE